MRPLALVLASLALAAGFHAPRPASPETDRIAINRNVRPAGTLRDGVLTLRLEARRGRWFPEADDGIGVDVHAFGESGRPPEIPGPLIRVPAGTEVRLTVRNALDSTLVLRGLHARPVAVGDTIQVAPGATRTVTFALREVGTFVYAGRSSADTSLDAREGADSPLSGALVVDPMGAGPPRDRVLVLGAWARPRSASEARTAPWGQALVVNGKSWPHTERLGMAVGDTVRWRVVNGSPRAHPMHLHGFYFRVESRGDGSRDSSYAPARQRLAVTELMLPYTTMAANWVPDRPGNWLLHCHFTAHVGSLARLHPPLDAPPVIAAPGATGAHAGHDMHGLAVGLQVRPAARPAAVVAVAQRAEPRAMRLLVHERADGQRPRLAFVLQRGAAEPAPDSIALPGSTLVLTRGETVRITVVNRMRRPTAVHWHGLEIESFPDGVPGWSGTPDRLMPAIAPRDSFVAEFTPPRAGTFMYHAHLDEQQQIGSGLYGAILVVDPGRVPEATERVLVFSRSGGTPAEGGVTLVNGRAAPDTVELTAGVAHRLRLVFIQPNGAARMTLRAAMPHDTALAVWRPLAKDGADLPASFTRPRAAIGLVTVGETHDYEFTPRAPGLYRLDFALRVLPETFGVVLRAR